jgi:hypothetical protein
MPASGSVVLGPDFVSVALMPAFGAMVLAQTLVWHGNDSFWVCVAYKCITGLANLLNLVEQCNF